MASVALLSIPPFGTAIHMLLIFRTTTISLTNAITGLPGLQSRPLFIGLYPRLHQCQQFDAFQVDFLLVPRFVGFHSRDNLPRFVSQGVDVVVHQLGEKPPIIILRYTHRQVLGVVALRHRTNTSA
jgi:hypothetical protein